MTLPRPEDFPVGTVFIIKEFDVPLAQLPSGQWRNYFGGTPRDYDPQSLQLGNNWPADSFTEWLSLVEESMA